MVGQGRRVFIFFDLRYERHGPPALPGLPALQPSPTYVQSKKNNVAMLRPSPGQGMEDQGGRTRASTCLERHLGFLALGQPSSGKLALSEEKECLPAEGTSLRGIF